MYYTCIQYIHIPRAAPDLTPASIGWTTVVKSLDRKLDCKIADGKTLGGAYKESESERDRETRAERRGAEQIKCSTRSSKTLPVNSVRQISIGFICTRIYYTCAYTVFTCIYIHARFCVPWTNTAAAEKVRFSVHIIVVRSTVFVTDTFLLMCRHVHYILYTLKCGRERACVYYTPCDRRQMYFYSSPTPEIKTPIHPKRPHRPSAPISWPPFTFHIRCRCV